MLMIVVTLIIAAVVSAMAGGVFTAQSPAPTISAKVTCSVDTAADAKDKNCTLNIDVLSTSEAIDTKDLKITVDITVATGGGSKGGGAAYGIYAARYIEITGGRITATAYGGSNTFGLDGGDVLAGDSNGGIVISGGYISVDSGGAATRNYGIDSKYGSVKISGNPVIFIREDESGAKENFAYNEDVTTITGGNAVVFAKEGAGNYLLREDAVLTQDAALLPGEIFEIPAGMRRSASPARSLSPGRRLQVSSSAAAAGPSRMLTPLLLVTVASSMPEKSRPCRRHRFRLQGFLQVLVRWFC